LTTEDVKRGISGKQFLLSRKVTKDRLNHKPARKGRRGKEKQDQKSGEKEQNLLYFT
jgi:hypothetical protein